MPAKQKQVPAADMAMPAPQFFGYNAMPAKHKQMPAAGMAMPAPQFFGDNAMPAKHKQTPAADMVMPVPQFFPVRARCLQSISRCLQQTQQCLRPNFFNTRAMPAKQKQVPAADMAMFAPQFFGDKRDGCEV